MTKSLNSLVFAVAVTLASTCWAQEVADTGTPGLPPREGGLRRPAGSAMGGGRFGQTNLPAEENIAEASAFMKQHAPNRWSAMEGLPEDGDLRRTVMNFVVARYRGLQSIKEQEPKLYEIKLQQLEIEDSIYGLVSPLHTPAEREAKREQIQEAARKLVELNLEERKQRIANLRSALSREEEQLRSDTAQVDRVAEHRANYLITEGMSALRRESMRLMMRPEGERRPIGAGRGEGRGPQGGSGGPHGSSAGAGGATSRPAGRNR